MPKDAYLEPYRKSALTHGSDFGVTLWASPESQRRRFRAFTEMCFLGGKRILDAGCSRGDFGAYLVEHNIPYARYIGVDGLCDVLEYAAARNLPNAEYHCGDMLREPELLHTGDPQIIAISGTLNTMKDRQIAQLLKSAWSAASETLMFNFLSDRAGRSAPPQGPPARRIDTMRWLNWALSQTPQVHFRQDYFPAGHDATIVMRKEQ